MGMKRLGVRGYFALGFRLRFRFAFALLGWDGRWWDRSSGLVLGNRSRGLMMVDMIEVALGVGNGNVTVVLVLRRFASLRIAGMLRCSER